jgi:TolA-binding protein
MIAPTARTTFAAFALLTALISATAHAQDVPGIEICTVEKTMERRTSCLQSNVDFLQKTITKLTTDHQQKLDASNRQIEALKAAVISLQKVVGELQSAQKAAEDAKKAAAPAAKDAAPAAKDATPAAKDGAK